MIRRPPRSTLFPARTAADGVHRFPDGGWTVWREAGLLVTFDHGPLGLGALAAHGHADALSVTIWRGTDGIAVDPGTFAYQEDAAARAAPLGGGPGGAPPPRGLSPSREAPAARARGRGTPVHSTVHFGGRSQ